MSPFSLMHLCYSWIEKAPACFMEDNGLKRIAQTRLKVLILGGPAYHPLSCSLASLSPCCKILP